jgi:hypothetical protein
MTDRFQADLDTFSFRGSISTGGRAPGIQQELRKPVAQITTDSIQNVAIQDGMITMLQDGVLKAIQGITTIEEVYRVVV